MQQETHIENIRALHSALVTKRATLDQLIWQAPVIALITQAFLMTIAFDTTNSIFYSCLSGSVVVWLFFFTTGQLLWQSRPDNSKPVRLDTLVITSVAGMALSGSDCYCWDLRICKSIRARRPFNIGGRVFPGAQT